MSKQQALVERPSDALAPVEAPAVNLAAMFERIAANPDVPVDKLQALMDMQRTILQDRAKVEFNEAMSAAQAEMRPVVKDALNPQTRSRYASYEALDRALRPVYSKHGFALSFNTEDSATEDHIRVTCLVSHRGGYERGYRVDMPADGKGAKGGDVMTKTHAAGSAMQYGMRYLFKLIFNVATADEEDDDGNRASRQAPDGYEDFLMDFEQVAEDGLAALQAAFNEAKAKNRACVEYLTTAERQRWEHLKTKAAKVKA